MLRQREYTPRLEVFVKSGRLGVEFGSGDSDEKQLAHILRWHIAFKDHKLPSPVRMNPSPLKIGLYGGTFDPIHNGHLLLARDALERLKLSKIAFIPANLSPHKLRKPPAPAEVRCEMIQPPSTERSISNSIAARSSAKAPHTR